MRVVVIGSGVAGAGTALALARRGISVTVVDAKQPGRATAAGAGIIQPWSVRDDGEFYEPYAAGAAYYPELLSVLAELGVDDIGFKRTGALLVAPQASELDGVLERLARRAAEEPLIGELQRVPPAVAKAMFPPLAGGLHGVHVPGGARVNGRMLAAGLLEGARRLGASVLHDSARLEDLGGRWSVVVGDGEALEADAVVVAAGAWTNAVLEPTGLTVPVEPQKGQIVHLRVDADTSQWPVIEPLGESYLLAFDDNRVVAGATRETGSGFDTRVTAAGIRKVIDDALAVAPGLADAAVIETRVGLRPYPASRTPTVGLLRGAGDATPLYVNAGFGAAGLTMGPVVGERLAAAIVG